MKNQKGITMTSLVLYIMAFIIVIAVVGSITIFFNSNINDINTTVGVNSEYNKFNLYMLKYTKTGQVVIHPNEDLKETDYITFKNKEDKLNSFIFLKNSLYFNNIKLCDNVKEFKVKKEIQENEKVKISTYIDIEGTVFTTDYIME